MHASSDMKQQQFFSQFTPREQEVFSHIVKGQSNKIIADLLGISEHTVEKHLQNIYSKLRVSSRTEAVWVYWQEVSKY